MESVIYPVTFNFYFYCHFKSSLDLIVIIFVTITIFNKMITLHHFTKLHYTLVFGIRSLLPIYYLLQLLFYLKFHSFCPFNFYIEIRFAFYNASFCCLYVRIYRRVHNIFGIL